MEQLTQRLTAAQIPYTLQEPLCSHCTFKIGGPAAVFVRPQNEMQLTEALAAWSADRYCILSFGQWQQHPILRCRVSRCSGGPDRFAAGDPPGWQYPGQPQREYVCRLYATPPWKLDCPVWSLHMVFRAQWAERCI